MMVQRRKVLNVNDLLELTDDICISEQFADILLSVSLQFAVTLVSPIVSPTEVNRRIIIKLYYSEVCHLSFVTVYTTSFLTLIISMR